MRQYNHVGAYGIIIKDNMILLIKKANSPYMGKLDLPGGTIEVGERPDDALKREFFEESGIEIKNYEIFDADLVHVIWKKENEIVKMHHIGIFYRINDYFNDIKTDVEIDAINDDSLGANFYHIENLRRNELSNIAILELEKMGYSLK